MDSGSGDLRSQCKHECYETLLAAKDFSGADNHMLGLHYVQWDTQSRQYLRDES